MSGFRLGSDWPPYASTSLPLDTLLVADASASAYRCDGRWRSRERPLRADLLISLRRGRLRCSGALAETLAAGQVLVAPAGSRLGLQADPGAAPAFAMLGGRLGLLGGLPLLGLLPGPQIAALPIEFNALAEEACRCDALRPAGWERSLESLLTAAFAAVLRTLPGGGPDPRRLSAARRIEPALAGMRASLDSPVKVAVLARRCGLSEPQFRRVFFAACGESPAAAHRRLRLAEARRLLRGSAISVQEVASRCGWADPSFFAKAFAAETGQSPAAWRQSPS